MVDSSCRKKHRVVCEPIALLVPSFQHEKYMPQLLHSVARQTRKPDEILISDDASNDGSWDRLNAWARRRRGVRLFRQRRNLGITENSNFLLKRTKAALVMFLHSDDLLLDPQALKKLEAMLKKNPGAVMAACGKRFLTETSKTGAHEAALETGLHAGGAVRRQMLLAEANLVGEPSCVMFRRRNLQGGFNNSLRQLWDVEAWLGLLRQGDLAYLAEPLVGIRRHAQQATRKNEREGRLIREHLEVYGRALAEEGNKFPAEDRYRLLYKLGRTARRYPEATSPKIRAILAREKEGMGVGEYLRQKIRYRWGRWFTRNPGSYQ